MPYIQPIIETLQDDPTHEEMMDMTAREPLTEEELEKWGQREGESSLEHARRCSHQIFGDRADLVQAIHDQDQDQDAVNRLLDEVTK